MTNCRRHFGISGKKDVSDVNNQHLPAYPVRVRLHPFPPLSFRYMCHASSHIEHKPSLTMYNFHTCGHLGKHDVLAEISHWIWFFLYVYMLHDSFKGSVVADIKLQFLSSLLHLFPLHFQLCAFFRNRVSQSPLEPLLPLQVFDASVRTAFRVPSTSKSRQATQPWQKQ